MGGIFGGGSVSTPEVVQKPETQATKSLSAGASAAAQAQKDRQRRNRGLSASIMTNRAGSGGLTSSTTGNTTLG